METQKKRNVRKPRRPNYEIISIVERDQNDPLRIPELLVMMLDNLSVFPDLFKLRRVSREWKSAIESICKRKRSLWLSPAASLEAFPYSNTRFVRLNRSEKYPQYSRNYYIMTARVILDRKFCLWLVDMFPNIEELVVDSLKDNGLSNLSNVLLKNWSNLTTLYLCNYNKYVPKVLFLQINQLKSLTRLYLCGMFNTFLVNCAELVSRLEHFAFFASESHEWNSRTLPKPVTDLMPLLGAKCIHLGLRVVSLGSLDRWFKNNSALILANIIHLQLKLELNNYGYDQNNFSAFIDLISSKFCSLKCLQLSSYGYLVINNEIMTKLSMLNSLQKLFLDRIRVEPYSTDGVVSLPFVNELHLKNLHFTDIDNQFNIYDPNQDLNTHVNRFFRLLSNCFPNLTIFKYSINENYFLFSDKKTKLCKAIDDNLHCFPNLINKPQL